MSNFFSDSVDSNTKKNPPMSRDSCGGLYGYRSYANFSTFFVYKKYDKIYKFFEDYKFHENEKKFNKMFSIDVSKCFDSIYTHTIPWAILGKDYVKNNLNKKYQDSF